MKGMIQIIAIVLILAALAAGSFYVYSTNSQSDGQLSIIPKSLTVDPTCRIIKPTWGFYKCEKSSVIANDGAGVRTTLQTGGFLVPAYAWGRCDYLDIAGRYQACNFHVDQSTSNVGVSYKICSGNPCDISDIGGASKLYPGQDIKLDFGQIIAFALPGQIVGTISAQITNSYYTKNLVYHDWFNYETLSKGVGCDIRSLLPYSEWSELPIDAKTSLQLDERQNFIVGMTDLTVIGNYFTYNGQDVICTQQHQIFKISQYQTATDPSTQGKYTTTGGACYYTAEANPIATVECCPGETVAGKTCDNTGHWVGLDKGVCVRGGIASVQLCPGNGAAFCDINTHQAFSGSTCDANTGNCNAQGSRYAACCPPTSGCPGDQFCDSDYTCKPKPTGLVTCNYECCPASWTTYQTKNCANGKQCCNGNCLDSCSGIDTHPSDNETDTLACNAQCNVKNSILTGDVFGISNAVCKAGCWVEAKMANIIVGILAAIFILLAFIVLSKGSAILIGAIVAVIVFVLTIVNIWVGIILLLIAIVGSVLGKVI